MKSLLKKKATILNKIAHNISTNKTQMLKNTPINTKKKKNRKISLLLQKVQIKVYAMEPSQRKITTRVKLTI